MEGGVSVTGGNVDYKGRITLFVIVTCLVAAMGGLIFGYDIGISGGVTSMESFLKEFFPSVYTNMDDYRGPKNTYCTFDSELLQLFTSSLYIAALVASIFASMVTRVLGRKVSMLFGGLVFLTGAILNGAAVNIEMLIMGRLLLGVGVGFANQSVPLYLSEMAPARIRGALNIGFQLAICIGILGANLVNYGTNKIAGGWGWRVSLGLAAVPAIIMSVGSLFLPDTPNSLIERGHSDKARKILVRIRGTDMVDDEYQDLVNASDAAKLVKHPWRNIFERKYRPHLVMSIMIPLFQQFTGINVIMFYAPVLFKSLGFADDAALMSAVITGVANVFCTLISCFIVDRVGRRMLFIEGGIQMLICQVVVGVLIGRAYGTSGEGNMSKMTANLVLMLVCLFVAAFAWSWGPLGWLVPSEIFPMEIRSAGQAINVSVNMLFTFIIAQAFLTMLCHLKFALFFFFAVWEGIMTLFIYLFLPETKGVPIEEMNRVWKEHWFWGKYIPDNASFLIV